MVVISATAMAAEVSPQAVSTSPALIKLQPVTIMGNGIDAILPNVDVINLKALTDPSLNNLSDALHANPAVEINAYASGSADQLRIRGLGENYTELTLDGQQMPAYFTFGPLSYVGRDFVEVDTLKQADIIKGLKSPKQGNGALAGTVNMQTYNPSDFVDAQNPFYASVKTGYTSKNRGINGTVTLAGAKNNLSGMVIYTHRKTHETENMGSDSTQTLQDKQNIRQNNLLAKGELALDKGRVLFTGEAFSKKDYVSPRYPVRGQIPPSYTDRTKRSRVQIDGNFVDVMGLDKADFQISVNRYSQIQDGAPTYFKRNGFNLQFDGNKSFDTGSLKHNLLFGVGYTHNKLDYLEQLSRTPYRLVPLTKQNTLNAYLKDQIIFNNGLTVSPGLKVAHQRLHSTIDSDYQKNPALLAPNSYVSKGSHTAVTPSLNITMPVGQYAQVFASYAHGVKFPDDSNLGGYDHGFGYIIPNADLKTEKSNNYELGFSYVKPKQLEFKVTTFYNKYRNFITFDDTGEIFGRANYRGRDIDKRILRPRNIDNVKTYGAELELGYHFNPQWYAHASLAWMKGLTGNNVSHEVVLNQAYPTQALLNLSYHKDDLWGADVKWTLVSKGKKSESATAFRTPGYGVMDFTAWMKPIKGLTVSAGVYNVFNKKYWLASDANGQSTVSRGQPVSLDNYTQPGRNYAVNFRYEF